MEKKLKLGVVGFGGRAREYFNSLKKDHDGEWELTAVCDISRIDAQNMINEYGSPDTLYYSDFDKMIDEVKFDGLLVCTPNHTHIDQYIKLLRRNINFLMEKPVVITVEECNKLYEEYKKSESKVLVGFVLRYVGFYEKVKELVDSGLIGKIMTIDATEAVGLRLTNLFSKTWRKERQYCGPFILEKCCHDFDVLRFITGAEVNRVSSFENRIAFVDKYNRAENCKECDIKDTCIYENSNHETEKILRARKFTDECVYKNGEHADHQVVILEFDNGILGTFNYSWGQIDGIRTIYIAGTNGYIIGNIHRSTIELNYMKDKKTITEIIDTTPDNESTHHGGDSYITSAMFKAFLGNYTDMKAGVEDGIEAAFIALAADKSSNLGGETVSISSLKTF